MSDELFFNKKVWKAYDEEELESYRTKLFNHYKSNGFPYFDLSESQLTRAIKNLKGFDTDRLIKEDDCLSQAMNGLNLVNYFMPHIFEVKHRNFKSPLDCFNDDEMLKKAIDKRLNYGDNMSDAGMRKALSWTHGTHRVSNFRPTIAKYIYDNYSGEGRVLDFSSGFGGRLFGAYSSDSVKTYVGTDPSSPTYSGLCDIRDYMSNHSDKKIILHNSPFEELRFPPKVFDLAFSSPPYFNTEEYAYEQSQSFVKFDTKEKWKNGFLIPLIDNCKVCLKDDGYFIINVANVKTYQNLEDDVVELAKQRGFKLVKTYKMSLSSLMSKGYKYEPIFVFKKSDTSNQ